MGHLGHLYRFSFRGLCSLINRLGSVDRYNGLHITLSHEKTADLPLCLQQITQLCNQSVPEFKAVWVELGGSPIFDLIPVLCRPPPMGPGLEFHHASKQSATLFRWLGEGPSRLPSFGSHQVGVAGVLLSTDQSHVLMVRERNSPFRGWKFPTGLVHLGENLGDAAVREVCEETGVPSQFVSIMAMRQQHDHPSAFGLSDLFFICRLQLDNAVSELPAIRRCEYEISECEWISLNKLLSAHVHSSIQDMHQASSIFTQSDQLHITTLTHQVIHLLHKPPAQSVQFKPKPFESIVPGQWYDLFIPYIGDAED